MYTGGSHSGPIHPTGGVVVAGSNSHKKFNSWPQSSGPQPQLPTPDLITTSGPMPCTSGSHSGPIHPTGGGVGASNSHKKSNSWPPTGSKLQGPAAAYVYQEAVTLLNKDEEFSLRKLFPRPLFWFLIVFFIAGFLAGGSVLVAVHSDNRDIPLLVVVILVVLVAAYVASTTYTGRTAIMSFIDNYPDSELGTAKNKKLVKISGVVTCGDVPLVSSFQKVPRCVYTSTSLDEYRRWSSEAVNPTHRRLSWARRWLERRVVDFYVSDSQSGIRALVRTGHGARVATYVDDSVLVNVDPTKEENLSSDLVRWLGENNLSIDDRKMRLEEGSKAFYVSTTGV